MTGSPEFTHHTGRGTLFSALFFCWMDGSSWELYGPLHRCSSGGHVDDELRSMKCCTSSSIYVFLSMQLVVTQLSDAQKESCVFLWMALGGSLAVFILQLQCNDVLWEHVTVLWTSDSPQCVSALPVLLIFMFDTVFYNSGGVFSASGSLIYKSIFCTLKTRCKKKSGIQQSF